jgi:hypothetical protein
MPRDTAEVQKKTKKYYQKNKAHVETFYANEKALPKQRTITQATTQYIREYGYTFEGGAETLMNLVRKALTVVKLQQPLSNRGQLQRCCPSISCAICQESRAKQTD